ncbi:ABC transporter substrate-binding protein [uncultured Maritalea sp.]|jgi:iron(III) transport system substrate-binding protein|uniref:ABC transporter substrate-binding protein n=1 Tax=uncultured Maritalea sp. TaxID=757249 RepID=UPI002607A8C3|nr:ABC transporter substrate-binding protein [uncultured Maritalea sp.]
MAKLFPIILALGTFLCATTAAHAQQRNQLVVLSATDTTAFANVLHSFEVKFPNIKIDYQEYNTRELYEHVLSGQHAGDVIISSAMDLQTDLVNKGLAHRFQPAKLADSPEWSYWLDSLFGFTFEPVAMVYNREAFAELKLPDTRSELAGLIRDNPSFFAGKIGTYDIGQSGVGYLLATQDTQRGYLYSRLIETFGRARAKVYCCTSEMIEQIAAGELVLGYNILGSYAHNAATQNAQIGIKLFEDYALVMTRTAFVAKGSTNLSQAKTFVSYLLSQEGQQAISGSSSLIPLHERSRSMEVRSLLQSSRALLPIRLGPNLLTYLDEIKRDQFLSDWHASLDVNEPQ